ncbi:uncharacterized protein LOC103362665 isoform X1 [Stegastes partitus]|uniref:Uncharacterized protein LOC103362665 isoform X1 n=1 Tax=Stegastes partitus TaxID=144197 RepID=A0A9Y4KD07_9TELE|nr:PREDICTED: uncharacterized protein LOC103362665 isoform X1 [Stegastes partitus]XP_008287317.1 PREDICTED: uncharacterized protein LOC103362665 isoform X1 [Stegastes partitus]
MQCSRPPSWSLSSTSWEGNWDTGGGTGPCRSRVDGAKAERCANNGVFPDSRPKSSRYCRQPLLNNLSASIALSFIASGFSVIFTLMDPVPQSVWAAYHVFGLLSCGHGLCTAILTLTAAACVRKTIIVCFTIKQNPSQWFVCVSTGPNHPRAVPHVPDSNSGLDSEYRFFPGERRTVVDDEAPSNGPKPRLKRSSCPTSETAHIKNS